MRVASNGHFGPNMGNTPIGADQERRTHNADEFSTIERLLLPYAVGVEHVVSSSDANATVSLCLDLNRSSAATGSAEIPKISVPARLNSLLSREKSTASRVQPLVSARG